MINFCRWFFLGLYNVFTIIPKYFINGIICIINPQKGKILTYKGKPIIPFAMISLTLCTYLICIFLGSKWYVQKLKLEYLASDIAASTKILEKEHEEVIIEEEYIPLDNTDYTNISYLSVDFDELLRKNSETVAWLRVNNTNIDYSVVKHNDNDYYLHHDFNQYNNANGWVFADFRDDFRYFGNNTIIYAHNLNNRTMFGSLVWVLTPDWHTNTDNQYIKLSTPYSNTVWRIFSIYSIKPEVYYLKTYFDTEDEHQEFIDTIKGRSIYDFGTNVSKNDKILTLSTCSDDGTKRVVVHAKMVKAEYR